MSKINLLPWREEKRKGLNRLFFFMLGGAIFLSIIILMIFNAYFNYKISIGTANVAYMNNEIKSANIEVAEVQTLQESKKKLIERMRIIQLLQTDRNSIVKLLDKIPHILPATIYLTELSRKESVEESAQELNIADTVKAAPKIFTENKPDLVDPFRKKYLVTIQGVSITNVGISEFLKNLEAVKGFSNVKLNEVSINTEGAGLSFKLEFTQNLTEME